MENQQHFTENKKIKKNSSEYYDTTNRATNPALFKMTLFWANLGASAGREPPEPQKKLKAEIEETSSVELSLSLSPYFENFESFLESHERHVTNPLVINGTLTRVLIWHILEV